MKERIRFKLTTNYSGNAPYSKLVSSPKNVFFDDGNGRMSIVHTGSGFLETKVGDRVTRKKWSPVCGRTYGFEFNTNLFNTNLIKSRLFIDGKLFAKGYSKLVYYIFGVCLLFVAGFVCWWVLW